jgi:hypothetical protein
VPELVGRPGQRLTLWKPESVQVTQGADHIGTYNKTPQSYRKWVKRAEATFTEHPGMGLTDVYAPPFRSSRISPASTSTIRKRGCE